MKLFKTTLIAVLATFSIAAQADTIMIRGATVHTMTEDGTLDNTDILITDGKIERIGKDLPVPQDDVYVFNAEGKPLTPGFFTDTVGFCLLVPAVRTSAAVWMLQHVNIITPGGDYRPPGGPGSGDVHTDSRGHHTIEGEFQRKE